MPKKNKHTFVILLHSIMQGRALFCIFVALFHSEAIQNSDIPDVDLEIDYDEGSEHGYDRYRNQLGLSLDADDEDEGDEHDHDGIRSKLDEAKRGSIHAARDTLERILDAERDKELKIPENAFRSRLNWPTDKDKIAVKKAKDRLKKIDRIREHRFKAHEIKKALVQRHRLESAKNDEERAKINKELKKAFFQRRGHDPVPLPGSKYHFVRVWAERYGLDEASFDVKTLFHLSDLDGNGFLFPDEIEALVQYSVDRVYDKNATERNDMTERKEDTNRMRAFFIERLDRDSDGLVNLREWMRNAERSDFDALFEWRPLVDHEANELFTEEELKAYQERTAKTAATHRPKS